MSGTLIASIEMGFHNSLVTSRTLIPSKWDFTTNSDVWYTIASIKVGFHNSLVTSGTLIASINMGFHNSLATSGTLTASIKMGFHNWLNPATAGSNVTGTTSASLFINYLPGSHAVVYTPVINQTFYVHVVYNMHADGLSPTWINYS